MALITARRFMELSRQGKIVESDTLTCHACKVELRETETGNRKYDGEYYCNDCYFEAFGELIDQPPIGVPHTRR